MDIILSNHVVWSKFGIKEKLTHHILEEIYKQLQPHIIAAMNGIETQLQFDKDEYKVSVPFANLRDISHHTDVIQTCVKEIQAIQIEFPVTRIETIGKKNKRYFTYTQRTD